MTNEDEFLEHHGIKGMHWGIRKRRSLAKAARKQQAEDFKTVQKLRKKKVSKLTSEELTLVNKRLNLEKNFSNLNPGKIEKGRQHVEKVLAIGATAGGVYKLTKSEHGQAFIRKFILRKGAKVVIKQGESFG